MPRTPVRPAYAGAWLGASLLSLAAVLRPAPAAAQLGLTWPDVPVRLEHYTTVEECLAMTSRVRDSVEQSLPFLRDTMAMRPAEAALPLPSPVVSAARRCGERFAAPAPLDDFAPLLTLYLQAGWDDRAEELVSRRLAAVAPKAEQERGAVLDSIAAQYLYAQPARLDDAERFVVELGKLTGAVRWIRRMGAQEALLKVALASADTARARRAADAIAAIGATLTAAERRSEDFLDGGQHMLYRALNLRDEAAALDSLRRSTASYVAMRRANWAKASGERGGMLRLPIGETAPPIHGDFWFGRTDTTAAVPTPGRVTLLVFMDHATCGRLRHCYPGYGVLHRLTERFPDLDVTLVTRTLGYVSAMTPPSPAEEAATLREWWLEKHDLDAMLAVAQTEFWRLPDPDRRRIDRDVANVTNYTFGRHWQVTRFGNMPGYLVDRRGTIVHASDVAHRGSEAELVRLVGVLLVQQTASR